MGFKNSHPITHLLYFSAALSGILLFRHPIYLAIAFASEIFCVRLSVGRGVWKKILLLVPAILLYAGYYASTHHFGVTVFGENRIGNRMTAESFVYGVVTGVIAALCILMFCIVQNLTSMDEIGYLLGKVSPNLSLFFHIILRMSKRIRFKKCEIQEGRAGIGKGVHQGSWWYRVRNRICIISILLTWVLENPPAMSDSMKNRGKIKRRRTSYSLFRLDDRDRAQIFFLTVEAVLCAMAYVLGQTNTIYDPEICLPARMDLTYLFYVSYAGLNLMPAMTDVIANRKFAGARRKEMCENEKQFRLFSKSGM